MSRAVLVFNVYARHCALTNTKGAMHTTGLLPQYILRILVRHAISRYVAAETTTAGCLNTRMQCKKTQVVKAAPCLSAGRIT